MAAFKLPRLKANLAIVDARGKPLDYFLRLFNIDLAQRIEQNETQQNEILDRLLAAELAAQQAQATADEALAAAEGGEGAKYADLNAAAGATTAVVTVTGVVANSRLQITGSLVGGTLSANADWNGTATFSEDNGTTTHVIGTFPITATSTGLEVGGAWEANDSSAFAFDVIGDYSGQVTYRVQIARTGGSMYVDGAEIRSILILTPKAAVE